MKIFWTVSKLQSRKIFVRKISKGNHSIKNVSGVSVLVPCTSSDDGLYLYQVS